MLSRLRLALAALFALVCVFSVIADSIPTDASGWKKYLPAVHGTLRPRFEMTTDDDIPAEYRFQLRNARLSLSGEPVEFLHYFVNVDLCDRGEFKFLDAWVRLNAPKGLSFQAGQFRMPFGIEPFRAPNSYLFSNRAFLGKQICNYRSVGAKAMWQLPRIPLLLEAGLFNPGTIADHQPWSDKLTWSGCATLSMPMGFKISGGYMNIRPRDVSTSLADATLIWKDGRWDTGAEYMYRHPRKSSGLPACHAYNFYASYCLPVKAWIFNRLSFQGRFDGMGEMNEDTPGRKRLTLGSTISWFRNKNLFLDLRADYEKYFYSNGEKAPGADDADKLVVELILRF